MLVAVPVPLELLKTTGSVPLVTLVDVESALQKLFSLSGRVTARLSMIALFQRTGAAQRLHNFLFEMLLVFALHSF